jgi:tetratricopeptide (TPR) repeat protein
MLSTLERYEEAILFFLVALEDAPEDVDMMLSLGNVLAALGRHEEAIKVQPSVSFILEVYYCL